MSVEIAWKQNILVTDFHLLKSLLVVLGFGSQAFVCGFSRQNINSVPPLRWRFLPYKMSTFLDNLSTYPPLLVNVLKLAYGNENMHSTMMRFENILSSWKVCLPIYFVSTIPFVFQEWQLLIATINVITTKKYSGKFTI